MVIDRSRAAARDSAAADSARAWAGAGDTVIGGTVGLGDGGTVSSLLIRALRAASAFRDRADSLELVIVSPFAEASFDAATDSIRSLWRGRVRLVRVPAKNAPAAPRIVLLADPGDPLRATVALLGARAGAESRIVRGRLSSADSAFARAGGVLVHWPRDPALLWPAARVDTVGAVIADGALVVAPFVRNTSFQLSSFPASLLIIAHWVDGAPAATESPLGSGCIRDVAIGVPEQGDLVLQSSMRDLVEAVAAPCGGGRGFAPVGDARLASLAGTGPLMPAGATPTPTHRPAPASAWLLAFAAALLLLETAVRPKARAA